MSKAGRKRAGGKRKFDIAREANGRQDRGLENREMELYVSQVRARKAAITGRDDMPEDVLGILFGYQRIEDEHYHIGRKLERLMNRIYGAPNAGQSAMFREYVSPPTNDEAAVAVSAMSDEDAKEMFMRMDRTLRNCGLVVHGLTIGAVRYCRYPRNLEQVSMIVDGLRALAKGHAPKAKPQSDGMQRAA